jgi:sortase (surface protein transpeptidase)
MDSLSEKANGELVSSATGSPVQVTDIVGPVGREVVTLITCEGTFNTRTREYDKRLVVRADRVFS